MAFRRWYLSSQAKLAASTSGTVLRKSWSCWVSRRYEAWTGRAWNSVHILMIIAPCLPCHLRRSLASILPHVLRWVGYWAAPSIRCRILTGPATEWCSILPAHVVTFTGLVRGQPQVG